MSRTIDAIRAAGQPVECLHGPDFSIAVLPHGGRVIGLFADGSDDNFFWTSAALANADSARALFASEQWQNPGGDRTWLGPELDLFYPRFPEQAGYTVPRQVDPGDYRWRVDGNRVDLTQDIVLPSFRFRETLRLRLSKSIEPVPSPLRAGKAPNELSSSLQFAGYSVRLTLELIEGGIRAPAGLWSLIQLPHGGEMIVPIWATTRPRTYFGPIPDGALRVEDRAVRYRMDAKGVQKIGVQALAATGRVGYLSSQANVWSLVVRDFRVTPSGLYADVPFDEPDDIGYAVQACNVCTPELGSFSELEYHVPAIGASTGARRSEDCSQVWAFRGKPEAIRRVAQLLLGCEVQPRGEREFSEGKVKGE